MKIVWSGLRGFSPNSLVQVPDTAGVYVLTMRQAKDGWRVFYVADSSNLASTLKRHLSLREPNTQLRRKITNCVVGFEYSLQPDTEVRQGITRFLVDYCNPELKPELNGSPIGPVEVNLPSGAERPVSRAAWPQNVQTQFQANPVTQPQ